MPGLAASGLIPAPAEGATTDAMRDDGPMADEQNRRQSADGDRPQVVVVGPDGTPIDMADVDPGDEVAEVEENVDSDPARLIEEPAKVMRIGSMVKQLLEEVRAAPMDEAGRGRLREIHSRSIAELEDGLAPELREELERITLPFGDGIPTEAEIRIAQAQLVGWLEGLFHGIQAAVVAQQMAARMQLEQMRGGGRPALPPGMMRPGGMGGPGGPPEGENDHPSHGTGQYL
ncbi:MAG: hypothetical protein QOC93_436 [Actinomycetota bacterium]|nr:hypothetical protein [Cryptosporangiaceae bacterium]MDQ1675292.1 hypothetical protein [Actinomycetota bacterium]